MPRLEVPAAAATAAHVNVEPTDEGLTGDFHLELLSDVIFFCQPPAVGTFSGQRHVDDLVGLLFGERAMGLGSVVVTRLAARRFRICLGRSFGERCGLAFLGPRGLLQELLQLRHALLQFGDPPFEPGTIRTPCCCTGIIGHATNIGRMAAYP